MGMDGLLRGARLIARAGAWFGGGLVVAAAFLTAADVVTRKLFSVSLGGGASELSGYVLAISTAWSFALALLDRAHIRIDTLYALLPVRLCAVLDMVALLVFLLAVALLTWEAVEVFEKSAAMSSRALTPLATPLAYPQFVWLAGLVFFLLATALLFLRAAIAFVSGDMPGVQRLIGSRTAVQELEDELQGIDAGHRTAGAE